MSKFVCKYDFDKECIIDNCDECKNHPMYQQGRLEAIKYILNQIPCQKNCQCCLRDGVLPCFVPTKDIHFYIKDIVDTLSEQLKGEQNE